MTDAIHEAATKARRYDAVINEGGEGFNPYHAEHDAAVTAKTEARMQDLVARADDLRAAWNSAIKSQATNGQLTATDIREIEKKVGVTKNEMSMLKDRMGW